MKAIFNKIMIGVAMLSAVGMTSCVGDLDQLPKDPSVIQATTFKENPKMYLSELLAKCYLQLANSGQGGASGSSDIKGVDGGTFQLTRCIIMLNEFPTDEMWWVYPDENGLLSMLQGTWGASTEALYGAYSRYYSSIGVCNDFLRTVRSLPGLGVEIGGSGATAISQAEVDQFCREARAIRAFTYYQVIDQFGRATLAWDNQQSGEMPAQASSRNALFRQVLADLEDVEKNWDSSQGLIYGRISRESVQALLCRYYLNAEIFSEGTMQDGWQKCWNMAQKIIANHEGINQYGGLVPDYLSVFCGSNDMFLPGGKLSQLNEILWGVPMEQDYTTAWGGTQFLVSAPLKNNSEGSLDPADEDAFCNPDWYMAGDAWGCAGSRQQLNEKFEFTDGLCPDVRTYLWLTDQAGCEQDISQRKMRTLSACWKPIKFTNLECNADGSMPMFQDPVNGLNRAGVHTEGVNEKTGEKEITMGSFIKFVNTDMPLIRLADVYLMAAEASLHNAGNKADGMKYLNYVRARAKADVLTNQNEMTEDFVLDERARELYWEGTRRTDLIRNHKFTSGYTWDWKGGVHSGAPLDSYRTVYPIPANIKNLYGKDMVQNPGY